MNYEDLKNPEFQERLRACSSPKELVEVVREQGVGLSDEQLEQVAGGNVWEDEVTCYEITCAYCGGTFETNMPEPRYCQLCGRELSFR